MFGADRVLKPGGVLAILGYRVLSLDNGALQSLFEEFYLDTLGSYNLRHHGDGTVNSQNNGDVSLNWWDCDRKFLDCGYEGLCMPYSNETLEEDNENREWFHNTRIVSLDSFFSYLKSMSAYQTLKQHKEDPLPLLRQNMLKQIGSPSSFAQDIEVTFSFFCITATKPNVK